MPTSTGTVATKPRKNGIFDNVDVTKRSLLFKCLRVARSHRENTAIPSTEGLSEGHCHNPLQNNGLKNGYSRTTRRESARQGGKSSHANEKPPATLPGVGRPVLHVCYFLAFLRLSPIAES